TPESGASSCRRPRPSRTSPESHHLSLHFRVHLCVKTDQFARSEKARQKPGLPYATIRTRSTLDATATPTAGPFSAMEPEEIIPSSNRMFHHRLPWIFTGQKAGTPPLVHPSATT